MLGKSTCITFVYCRMRNVIRHLCITLHCMQILLFQAISSTCLCLSSPLLIVVAGRVACFTLTQGICGLQLESERQQEAEEAARVHNEMQEAHTRLKRLDKDLKQLTTHQVHTTNAWCLSV